MANEQELEQRVQDKMESMGLLTPDEVEEEIIDDDTEEVDATAQQTVEEEASVSPTLEEEKGTQADDSTGESEPTSDADGEDDKVEGIPDAYYRAALHQQWTPEEINEFYKQNPVTATKTFKKLYDDTNRMTNEFAAVGREKAKMSKPDAEEKPQPKADAVDLTELKEQYGDDNPLVKVVEALVKAQPEPQKMQDHEPAPQDTVDAATRTIIDNFFGASQMEQYDKLYGKGTDEQQLTMAQAKNRWRVLNLADEVMQGATALGRTMSAEQALEVAHLQVSEPMREEVIRKDIVAKVKKRGNSLSLKPVATPAAVESTRATSEADAEARASERLSKLKW